MAPGGPLDFDDEEPAGARAGRAGSVGPHAPAPRRAPPGPQGAAAALGRHGWSVGVIGVVVVLLVVLAGLRTGGPRGRGVVRGGQAPPFAAPLALSRLAEADHNQVNLATRAGQGDAGDVAACSIRSPEVLNFCALYRRGPVVLAFFVPTASCVAKLDPLEAAARRHPAVAFAAVSLRGRLDALRAVVRDRRWSFPVGYDDDGVLRSAFGVVACPQVVFVRRGGRVVATSTSGLDAAGLEARVAALGR